MNKRDPLSLLAWLAAGLTLALLLASVVFALGSRQAEFPPDWTAWDSQIVTALGALPVPLLGGLMAARRPRNLYGWLWLAMGLGFGGLLAFAHSYATYSLLAAPAVLPFTDPMLSIGGFAWLLGVSAIPFLLLLFPTGHLPSRRWRPVAWFSLSATLAAAAVGPFAPSAGILPMANPYAVAGRLGEALDAVLQITAMLIFVSVLPGIASLQVRYRRGSDQERSQLKWFAYGAVLFGVLLASDFVLELPGIWEAVKESLFSNILVAAVAIAVLRHRLWDIDLVIRRTLLYSALTGCLAAFYFGSVVLLEGLLRVARGGQSPLVIVISTLGIAAVFMPLRRRLQAFIDRRFYRRKYRLDRALAGYADSLRDQVDLQQIADSLIGVVDQAVQPTVVSMWIKEAR